MLIETGLAVERSKDSKLPPSHGLRFKDLAGRRFGHLTVVQVADRDDWGSYHWLCKCDCGKEKTVHSSNLIQGRSASCGYCPRRKPEGEPARNDLLFSYKYQAKRRGHAWELADGEFDKLTSSDCYYCGLSPSTVRTSRSHKYIYNGIDRVDNTLGYIQGNVVTCCSVCNLAKHKMPFDDFMTWIARLTAYQAQFQGRKF
jgi:hypothetical protein